MGARNPLTTEQHGRQTYVVFSEWDWHKDGMRFTDHGAAELLRTDVRTIRKLAGSGRRCCLLKLEELLAIGKTLHGDDLGEVESRAGRPVKWWPMGKAAGVVVDPHRRFGKPSVAACGTSTHVLYRQWLAEDRDAESVAEWYGVKVKDVEDAVRFEEWLLTRAESRAQPSP